VVTSSGYPLSPAITIPSNAHCHHHQHATASSRCCQPGSATPVQVGTIQLASFVNNGGLQSMGENLFLETAVLRHADAQHPGHQRRRPAQPGLCRDIQRQRGRGTGEP
jgi:flagellar basal-body rod protein FlgG